MINFKVQLREIRGKKNQGLRKQGSLPGVVYGHGLESTAVEMPYLEFEKLFKQAGESSIIDLTIADQKPIQTIIHEVQVHPVTDRFEHIDFYKIKAGEKIKVEIELNFEGEAPAVKNLGGILVHNLEKVEIQCLPKDLIHEIKVDINGLNELDEMIRIKDLIVPETVEILHDPEDMVVGVKPPRKEEEEPVVGETTEEGEVPVEGEGEPAKDGELKQDDGKDKKEEGKKEEGKDEKTDKK